MRWGDLQGFEATVLYWLMPALLLALAGAAWAVLQDRKPPRPRAWLRQQGPGLAISAALTALCFVVLPPLLRVQLDESIVAATSLSMLHQNRDFSVSETVPGAEMAEMVSVGLDKRPPLFPFLVSVVHGFLGPGVAHAFVVNALLLFVLLFLVYAAVRARSDLATALAAALLVASSPALVMSASSGGVELLAVLLLASALLAALHFADQPSPRSLALLLALGALYAYSRYEAAFVFTLLLAASWTLAWRERRWRPRKAALLLLAIWGLAHLPLAGLALAWRDPAYYAEAHGQSLFGAGRAVRHLGAFLLEFFDPRPARRFDGLADLGVPLVVFALARARKRPRALVLWALAAIVPLAIALAWFYGDPRELTAARLFLGAALFGSLSPVWLRLLWPKRLPAAALVAFAVVACGAQLASVARARESFVPPAARVVTELEDLWRNKDYINDLFVCEFSSYIVARGLTSIYPRSLPEYWKALEVRRAKGYIRDIYYVSTPYDTLLERNPGDNARVLREFETTIVASHGGAVPLTVYRVLRRRSR